MVAATLETDVPTLDALLPGSMDRLVNASFEVPAEEIDELLDEIRKPKRARRKASTPAHQETTTA